MMCVNWMSPLHIGFVAGCFFWMAQKMCNHTCSFEVAPGVRSLRWKSLSMTTCTCWKDIPLAKWGFRSRSSVCIVRLKLLRRLGVAWPGALGKRGKGIPDVLYHLKVEDMILVYQGWQRDNNQSHQLPEISTWKRWFPEDDSKSLHEKWFFRQTCSCFKLLVQVPKINFKLPCMWKQICSSLLMTDRTSCGDKIHLSGEELKNDTQIKQSDLIAESLQ